MSRWKCLQASLLFFRLVFCSKTNRDELFKQARLNLLKGLEYFKGEETHPV